MILKHCLWVAKLLCLLACLAAARDGMAQPEHAVVVCLGDSITRAGYPEELAVILRTRVLNAGVNGSTSRNGLSRLPAALTNNPRVLVACFGANDSRLDAPKTQVSPREYESNLVQIVTRSWAAGAQVVLMTPPPIDPAPYYQRHPKEHYERVGGLEKWLEQYRHVVLKIAREKDMPVVDLNRLLADHSAWRKTDGVHPTDEGTRLIAQLVAKAVGPLLVKPGTIQSRQEAGL